jgi:crotonobetainyl-CoA:carnitine CoA-transferase CaiB-like acyl-CoA transferase
MTPPTAKPTRTPGESAMTRPFEGIKIIDITHVLAGPFAAYQLAVLGADVIKVEHPLECDQSRHNGPDRELNRRNMGTGFMTQGSNKRSITLDLKQPRGREILKRLVKDADVMVENYRPGAFTALGIGYEDMKKINPRLIYCSMTAFGQDGPRGSQTAYDHAIQALSGVMAATGTPETNPIKVGTPVIDYATGTMGAFAIASALFQRERTGKGQYIDSAMLDVALMMQASHVTGYMYNGKKSKPSGNRHNLASSSCYETKDGLLMLAASNRGQHKRLFDTLGYPEMGNKDYDYREDNYDAEAALLRKVLAEKTAAEWEDHLQAHHVPAGRVRPMDQALKDPQLESRKILHRHESVPGTDKPVTVPMCAFKFAHGGPSIERPPARLGEHNEEILQSLGYTKADIEALRADGVI